MTYRRFLVLSLFALPAALPSAATHSGPVEVLLARGRTEPTVAISPLRPGVVVASANTNYSAPVDGTFPTAYFYSADGGRSFNAGTMPMIPPFTTGADTSVVVARDGTVFYSYLGEAPAFCGGGGAAVVLSHSIDNGKSYRRPVAVDINPDDDKPNLAVESIRGKASHIFVTWTRWHDASKTSDVWISRSLDGGVTFSRPARLWSSRLANFGTVPVVGPRGRIYVFWSVSPNEEQVGPSPTGLFAVVSGDDGAHFGRRFAVTRTFRSVPDIVKPGNLRVLTMPSVVLDGRGTLYVAWAQVERVRSGGAVDADIVLSRSVDGGRSWSTPRRVNDARNGARFMPSVVLLAGGSLAVVFYDQRRGGMVLDTYAARARFGSRFRAYPNLRLDSGTSPVVDMMYVAPGSTCLAPGRFFGDYIGAVAMGRDLGAVWADTQLHQPDETDVWFARVTLPGS
ncbi:MAG TPA: sialidase family protein [Chloroflexota bacterium]|nr:sialidase family protein [Chloroflexota bacterium]